MLQLGKAYQEADPNLTIQYANQAKEIALKINYKKGEAMALKDAGLGHYRELERGECVAKLVRKLTI